MLNSWPLIQFEVIEQSLEHILLNKGYQHKLYPLFNYFFFFLENNISMTEALVIS